MSTETSTKETKYSDKRKGDFHHIYIVFHNFTGFFSVLAHFVILLRLLVLAPN